ncbi:hypothetical protein OSJ77_02915 [Phyllobacterium sp. 0TCS1.6C]|jgi:hypothetical protein|uniref:hypothetical protein n=1 Tax=unclassified Phyllobacterium TaxID=2638441 RepID=UPI00226547B0|nr:MULTISPECIES: hypothetical protein [unclassified Phyllobacterium]MCX8279133.1 hypothetical protein [Phyllobacterium sp. 0TCS1.6C]MCX8293917.1 hypothetical protein [Phyllobacterium sp. 0TCS1.6A]
MTNGVEAFTFSLLQRYKMSQLVNPARILMAATLAIGLAGAVQAQASSPEAAYSRTVKAKKTGKPTAMKKLGRPVATKASYLGRAPWICTPSGFGQTSRCFPR